VDETRFDDMAKALGRQTTRRLTVSAFLGGALGVLGVRETEAASSGCGKDCGECKTCKRGTCKTKNGKKRCRRGKCESLADGAACSLPTSGTCQSGVCRCLNGTIESNGQCLGRCPLGQQRDPASAVCCIPSGTGPCKLGEDNTCCKRFCENSPEPPYSICT
jgi:hypothetical protein